MSLNGSLAAELDAGSILAHTGYEIRQMEASIVVIPTRRDDVGRSQVPIHRRDELRGEFGEVPTYQRANVACLVAGFEEGFDVRDDVAVGF